MPERLIVNVIGHPNCGKSTGMRWLAKERGFEVDSPSAIIAQYAQKVGLPLTSRSAYSDARRQLLAKDPNALVRVAVYTGGPRVGIDGLRVPAQWEKVRNCAARSAAGRIVAVSVALVCPIGSRFKRELASEDRRFSGVGSSFEDFLSNESGEYSNADPNELAVQTLMDEADFRVDTDRPEATDWLKDFAAIIDSFAD